MSGSLRRIVWCCIAISSAPAARADDFLPVTPRTMAMGGAYTALSDEPTGLYFNPAGLAQLDGSVAELAFAFSFPALDAGPSGQSTRRLSEPGDQGYGLHLAWSPEQLLAGDLSLGFSVMLPHRRAVSFLIHAIDDPYFVQYENSTELLELRLGAAYKFFDLFSIGFSMLLLAGLDGDVAIVAPFQSGETDPNRRTEVSLDAILPERGFFTAGLQVYPLEGLTLGLCFREATFVRVRLPIDFTPEIFELNLATLATLDVKVKYAPAALAFGAAYRFNPEWLIALDLTWARTSEYEVPYGSVDLDVSNLGDGITLLPPLRPNADLRDTLTPRIGAEWAPLDGLLVRAGYAYIPTFVKSIDQPVLDSDKHSFTAGASYRIDRLVMGETSVRWTLSTAGQLLWYTPRTTSGFDHSGAVFGLTAGTQVAY